MDLFADFFEALRRMHHQETPERSGDPCPAPHHPADFAWRTGPAGFDLIRAFEGCARRRSDGRYAAYPDPATGGAPWTIGWGATGPGITRGTIWARDACDARLASDVERFAAEVRTAIGGAATSQCQFDALVSFHYNTGASACPALSGGAPQKQHSMPTGDGLRLAISGAGYDIGRD